MHNYVYVNHFTSVWLWLSEYWNEWLLYDARALFNFKVQKDTGYVLYPLAAYFVLCITYSLLM